MMNDTKKDINTGSELSQVESHLASTDKVNEYIDEKPFDFFSDAGRARISKALIDHMMRNNL